MLPFLVLMAVAYVAVAPDSRTHATSRGAAGAGRAAAVGAYRQVRGDWQSGRPARQKTYRKWRTRLANDTWGSGLLVGWDVLRFGGRGARVTARSGYRAGRAAYRSGRDAYRPAAQNARQKRTERQQRRIGKRLGMDPGSVERLTTLTGNPRWKTDDWTATLTPQADGTTRADIHYAGLPDLGAQPVTTVTGATPEEARGKAEDAIAYQQMQHGKGAPARIAWIHPDPPTGTSPAGPTTPPITEGTDMQLSIKPTELTDTSALRGETKEARQVFEELREALEHVQKYLTGLGDRYAGAPFGTEKLSRSVTALTEHASGVDPAAVDALLADVTALEEALTEAEGLGEHASAVKADGPVESFQPA